MLIFVFKRLVYGSPKNKINNKKERKIKMKKNVKVFSKEVAKIFGIALVIALFLGMMPYCRGILSNSNYYLVTDKVTAEQVVSFDKNSGILVEFQCSGSEFLDLLNRFVKVHKNLRLAKIETLSLEKSNQTKGFLVTFFRK